MEHRIAVSHASGIAAEAILEKLSVSGVTPDSLILLDDESQLGNRLPYADGYLSLQDQNEFDFSNCALLLMPEADDRLAQAALAQGCLLVSHAIDTDTPVMFIDDAETTPEVSYTETSFRLAEPELCCLLPLLIGFNRNHPIEHLNTVLLRSAEFRGKAGVDELASQAIDLLNARAVKPAIYPQQIAFNLLTEASEPHFDADLNRILGNNSFSTVHQTINVPIFHGFAAAVQIRFTADVTLEGCSSLLASLDNVIVKNLPITPISDCNQSFSCVISHLELAPDQPSCLRFWMIADPMRYGLANNYVNVAEFLLKSFL